MKKKSCRRTEHEDSLHERAVKVRKMTDAQLVGHIEEAGKNAVLKFIEELNGVPGIGLVTIKKLKEYAERKLQNES